MNKYKLTLIDTEFLCLEDSYGKQFIEKFEIKHPPIIFDSYEEMMEAIKK